MIPSFYYCGVCKSFIQVKKGKFKAYAYTEYHDIIRGSKRLDRILTFNKNKKSR